MSTTQIIVKLSTRIRPPAGLHHMQACSTYQPLAQTWCWGTPCLCAYWSAPAADANWRRSYCLKPMLSLAAQLTASAVVPPQQVSVTQRLCQPRKRC